MASRGLMDVLSNNVNNYVNHRPTVYREICTILCSSVKGAGVTERPGLKHESVNSVALGNHLTSEFEFTHLQNGESTVGTDASCERVAEEDTRELQSAFIFKVPATKCTHSTQNTSQLTANHLIFKLINETHIKFFC